MFQPKTTAPAEFKPRRHLVNARRVLAFCVIDTNTGPATLMPGDWIVRDDAGQELGMTNADFRRWFEPTDGEGGALANASAMDLVEGPPLRKAA